MLPKNKWSTESIYGEGKERVIKNFKCVKCKRTWPCNSAHTSSRCPFCEAAR
jgi:predicted Zn-ribbon and HTH transcriptional regulator